MSSPSQQTDPNRDLGFGTAAATKAIHRLLNRDGTFNMARRGLGWRSVINPYHRLLTMSWPEFLALVAAAYVVVNLLFGTAYFLAGASALDGVDPSASWWGRWLDAVFFSVQTLSTVGYGSISPQSVLAHLLVALEVLVEILGIALTTGIVFARFSRPVADVLYSDRAVVAPYQDGTGFMFRIANQRHNQISEVEATVIYTWRGPEDASRQFAELELERHRVSFFPLTWTIVHPITPDSPLWERSFDDLQQQRAEFLVLLKGFDETFSQTVLSRSSYRSEEVEFGVKFVNLLERTHHGAPVSVDLSRLHEVVPAELPIPTEPSQ